MNVVYAFHRYGTDYTVRWSGPNEWQFRRKLRSGKWDSYFAQNCPGIRDAVSEYFLGVNDREAADIVASMSASKVAA